jgi:adenine-specific DNA methylase
MKYMGSKRWMLQNGLGEILRSAALESNRFVDLFAGSGAVAAYVAQNVTIPVQAFDLQHYSAVLTGAILHRTTALPWKAVWERWFRCATQRASGYRIPTFGSVTAQTVVEARRWCETQSELPLTQAYGGHYFSPEQSVMMDALRFCLPSKEPEKTVALAALIRAVSGCAASPGHTAQPFQPTVTALRFIQEAWSRNVAERARDAFIALSQCAARVKGRAEVSDANDVAYRLKAGDLAFIDPPYSGVHYSRFYHVLESVAHGTAGTVSGAGRYPEAGMRPRSRYSVQRESRDALSALLQDVAAKGAKAIITFPAHECSNRLSGDFVREVASQQFHVQEKKVESRFSTLGGPKHPAGNSRGARRKAFELIFSLTPR